jgi:hypothetical protein
MHLPVFAHHKRCFRLWQLDVANARLLVVTFMSIVVNLPSKGPSPNQLIVKQYLSGLALAAQSVDAQKRPYTVCENCPQLSTLYVNPHEAVFIVESVNASFHA